MLTAMKYIFTGKISSKIISKSGGCRDARIFHLISKILNCHPLTHCNKKATSQIAKTSIERGRWQHVCLINNSEA